MDKINKNPLLFKKQVIALLRCPQNICFSRFFSRKTKEFTEKLSKIKYWKNVFFLFLNIFKYLISNFFILSDHFPLFSYLKIGSLHCEQGCVTSVMEKFFSWALTSLLNLRIWFLCNSWTKCSQMPWSIASHSARIYAMECFKTPSDLLYTLVTIILVA